MKRTLKAVALLLTLAMILPCLSVFASVELPFGSTEAKANEFAYSAALPDGSVIASDTAFDFSELNADEVAKLAQSSAIIKKSNSGTVTTITDPKVIAEILGENYDPDAKPEWVTRTEEYGSEIVDVTVVLDGGALSETKGLHVGDSIDAKAYNAARRKLVAEHKSVAEEIKRTIESDIDITADYCITINGFAVRTARKNISDIRRANGVKTAFEAPVFTVEPDEIFNSGAEQQGTYLAWDCGYKGEGMTVAVIDTGCYLTHEAFATMPDNPKFSRDDIESKLNNFDFGAEERMSGFSVSDAYVNAKFPFVFDYSENDANVYHTNRVSAHGTHVAGIIGADMHEHTPEPGLEGDFPGMTGIAPECQLIIMKVFSGEGASFTDIITAMEDSILLGVDAVNLSLGAPAGYDYMEGITEVFDAANAAGINVVVSAGNDSTSAVGNKWGFDLQLASNPDNGIVGSPAVFASNLSVASVNANKVFNWERSEQLVFYTDNNNEVYGAYFYDKAPYEYRLDTRYGGQTFDFVIMDGYDFTQYDTEGKIVFVRETDEIPTQELYNQAVAAKAAVLVVEAMEDGEEYAVDMDIENYEAMPCVSIIGGDSQWMLDCMEEFSIPESDRKLTVSYRYVDNPDGIGMSDFSSWGPTLDLRIKPEISAVGGNVWSTWNNNSYAETGGTSMAAPQIAGAAAIVKQYLKANYPELSDTQLHDTVNAILMSTASQVTGRGGYDCSPRNQGAGLLNLYKAVNTEAYITVDGCDKPKLELGDDPDKTGIYTLRFNVVNMGSTEKVYDIDITALTEMAVAGDIKNGEPLYFMFGEPYALYPEISGDSSITVPAHGTASAEVTVKLSAIDLAYIREHFENGTYVDGFVKLIERSETPVNLSAPFLAFYGDWTALSVLDETFAYNCLESLNMNPDFPEGRSSSPFYNIDMDYSSIMPHMALTSVNGNPFHLGDNFYRHLTQPDWADNPMQVHAWSDSRCYISPNGDGICDGIEAVYTSVLRNTTNVTYRITNTATGDVYYEKSIDYCSKYNMDNDGNLIPFGMDEETAFDPWYGTDAEGNLLPDGTEVYVSIECETMYRGEVVSDNSLSSWGFRCKIDTGAPEGSIEFISQSTSRLYYTQKYRTYDDGMVANTYINCGLFGDVLGGVTYMGYNTEEPEGTEATPTFKNITTPTAIASLIVTDYAGNRTLVIFNAMTGDNCVELDCPDVINMRVGDTLDVSNIYTWPEHINGDACYTEYSSSDASVASVVGTDSKSGKITANAAGSTVIRAAVPMTICSKDVVVNVYERTYSITSSANAGGTITESREIPSLESAVFTITPDEHYHIADVLVDGQSIGITTEYTFENITSDHTIEAVFEINPEDVFAVYFVDYDGTMLSSQMVERGHAAVAPTAPTREHYRFVGWSCEFSNITANTVVVAQYELDITLGDVNFDGIIDCVDALSALRIAMGIADSTELERAAADVNSDYNVNVDDALSIMRHSLGICLLND